MQKKEKLTATQLRYIRKEADKCLEKKLEEFKTNTQNALQVFDETAVMVRFADVLASREGDKIWEALRKQMVEKMRSGALSAKYKTVGLDISRIPELKRLKDEFAGARSAIEESYIVGVEVLKQTVQSMVDNAYLNSMPESCVNILQTLRGLSVPGLPSPTVR